MYIVIAGGESIGELVAKSLEARGEKIVVIDKDPEVCERLREELGINVINGDATDIEVLKKIKVNTADVLLALSGQSEINIMIALAARLCGAKRVILRIDREEYFEVCKMLGFNEVIYPARSAAIIISEMLRGVMLTTLIELHHKKYIEIEGVKVNKVRAVNEIVKELSSKIGCECHPIAIVRRGNIVIPRSNAEVRPGDELICIRKVAEF
ncbi:hypothetical protein DRN86_02335 [Candidatus Geothermarchaeota archaeon]|nr:MAG: hypothetical protein DRN86_02335 [Candidatus Geothermarchaeota archaeon]